jgi:hypothetical protein
MLLESSGFESSNELANTLRIDALAQHKQLREAVLATLGHITDELEIAEYIPRVYKVNKSRKNKKLRDRFAKRPQKVLTSARNVMSGVQHTGMQGETGETTNNERV